LTSILGRLGFGWLGDKFNKRLVATAGFIMMGTGVFCFAAAATSQIWLLVPFIIVFGIGYGGTNAVHPALSRDYFGRTNFGSIYGITQGLGAMGGMIGPTLAGWAYDNWGSYQTIWWLLAGLAIIALISVLTITPVDKVKALS
jgi:MFS family permease